MAKPVRLFDLFGDFRAAWPSTTLRDHIGEDDGPSPNLAVWLDALDKSLTVTDIRTGANATGVAVEAKLHTTGFVTYPLGWPLSFTSMPDVLFNVLPFTHPDGAIGLFAAVSDAGVELVLEGVPVEIQLPRGLVAPPDRLSPAANTKTVGTFTAGSLDALKIVYNEDAPTSIFVHVRVRATTGGEYEIETAVPISFEACRLSGIPAKAVHDFRLIPSPGLAPDGIEWVRHPLTPWAPAESGLYDGLFGFRTLELDTAAEPLHGALEQLRNLNVPEGQEEPIKFPRQDSSTDLVISDTAVPWFSPWLIPVPRHVTVGLRRRVIDPADSNEVYDFKYAPVKLSVSRDPRINLIVESLFYTSRPFDELETDLGLTFEAAVAFGMNTSNPAAFRIGLGENYTIRTGYRREYVGAEVPGPPGPLASFHNALHFEIGGAVFVDIIGFQAGYSVGRAINERADFMDCAELTVDLWVSMPPTSMGGGAITLRGLSGEPVNFAIEALGWRQGSFHLEGLAMPDGVVVMFANIIGIVIEELAVVAEQGASYFSISAGLLLKLPSGIEGGAGVTRLRFRIAGDPSAPSWKLDGFWVLAKGSNFQLEVGGFFTDEQVDDTRVKEIGLTGTFGLEMDTKWVFGLDVLSGERISPTDGFKYFMLQVFFTGSIKFGAYFELRGARVLFSANMRPKLGAVDAASRDLRYFKWYRNSKPIDVPGTRRLAAWQAEKEAWSFGIGVSASIPPVGKLIEFSVFVLGLGGPTEKGLLIVAEIKLLSSPKPVAYAAIEWDMKNDRISVLAGLDLKLDTFVTSIPKWLSEIGKLTGTIYISNDPPTFAIGRLADQRTWLSLMVDFDLMAASTHLQFGICVEIVGKGGPKGFGTVARLEGGMDCGIVRLNYGVALSFVVEFFTTGSVDYALVLRLEASLRLTVFVFLTFGISASLDLRVVGARPTRGELRAEFRLETPWFLPDVTCTFQTVWGEIVVDGLATSVQPLRSSAANGAADRKSVPVHIERALYSTWTGEEPAPVHSIAELRATTVTESDRLSRFAADKKANPVATDATIPIDFSVSVNDKLGLGTGLAPSLGNQKSGDLTLTYDLVGLRVRRRPRFGASRAWTQVDQRIELATDFSDPDGVKLTGSFAPQVLNKFWDADVKVDGKIATKKLLINSKTPFDFATVDAESDELIATTHPSWPCCESDETDVARWLTVHRVDYENVALGTHVEAPRAFSRSASLLSWSQPARSRDVLGVRAARVDAVRPGTVASATFDEDAAFVMLRLLSPSGNVTLNVFAYDAAGVEVARKSVPHSGGQFAMVLLPGQGRVRRFELVATFEGTGGEPQAVALHWATYISFDEYISHLIREAACASGTPAFKTAYSGHGKVAWLPNHEYEIEVATRITGMHPSVSAKSADVKEYVYFKTKGHPGLNAVDRLGAEVESFVTSAYTGGRGRLYRCEPITIAFSDDYAAAIPLAARPAGTSAERVQLLQLQLTARPEVAIGADPTRFTATGTDWLTAHRATVPEDVDMTWESVTSTAQTREIAVRSSDPMVTRLAGLTQRPEVTCELDDPRLTRGSMLVAPPQGPPDPVVAGGELWPARTRLSAIVRPYIAGHVEREQFSKGDETAFEFALDDGPDTTDWKIEDGELTVGETAVRRYAIFGEPEWNHVRLVVSAASESDAFGLGVGVPAGSAPASGLFAVVERTGASRRLAVYRRAAGGPLSEVDDVALPDAADATTPITLEVIAYDDQLEARVGDTRLRIDRGEQGAGRCCLVATGPARFRSLSVHGLDVFGFTVGTSRFRSFEEHVHSFDGTVAPLAPDALGAGATTTTVAALWSATQSEVAATMAPAAEPGARQALFDRWVAGLGLPLRVDLAGLSISAVRDATGATTALLLESPEPLDFTTEITPTLTRRVGVWTPRPIVAIPPTIGVLLHGLDGSLADLPTPRPPTPSPVTVTAVGVHPGGPIGPGGLGTIAIGVPGHLPQLGQWTYTDEPVSVAVLQDRDGLRALLIPVSAGSATPLVAGDHQLALELERARYETTAAPDDVSRYAAVAAVSLTV